MSKRMRIASGVAAIWDGAEDTAPFSNPLGNLSRLKFHSSLDYIKITSILSFSVSIPATGAVAEKTASYTLGPHGVSGQPLIVPYILVNGIWVAFTGHVPVHQFATGDDYARFLSCGVDATNIIVHEYSIQTGVVRFALFENRPAQVFQVRVGITNVLLS